MPASRFQFSLYFLLELTALVAMVLASILFVPPIPHFVGPISRILLVLSMLTSGATSIVIAAIRQPLSSARFRRSVFASLILGGWGGFAGAFGCDVYCGTDSIVWPGIGGGFIVTAAALISAALVSGALSMIIPRDKQIGNGETGDGQTETG